MGWASKKKYQFILSHKLLPTQQRLPITEKEFVVIVYTLQNLHYYLDGEEFVIKTDYKLLLDV